MKNINFLDVVSEHIYVKVPKNYRKEIFNSLIKEYKTKINIAKLVGVPRGIVSQWYYGKYKIPLSILNKIYPNLKYQKLKFFSRNGLSEFSGIKKFIESDENFARLLGHIYGDGSIVKNFRVCYTNKNKNLIEDFVNSAKHTFGNIHIYRYYNPKDDTININLSSMIGRFLCKIDETIKKQLKIPSFIINSKKLIRSFIGALFDDDGYVNIKDKSLSFGLANYSLLVNIKKLLNKIGINTSEIRKKVKNKKYIMYEFCIYRRKNLLKFYKQIELKHEKKKNSLKKIIFSYKKRYIKHELEESFLDLLANNPEMKASQISNRLKTSLSCVCKTLRKLESKGFIKSFKGYYINSLNRKHPVNFWSVK